MPRIDIIQNKYPSVEGLTEYLQYYAEDIINNVEFVSEQEKIDFRPGTFSRIPARYQDQYYCDAQTQQRCTCYF